MTVRPDDVASWNEAYPGLKLSQGRWVELAGELEQLRGAVDRLGRLKPGLDAPADFPSTLLSLAPADRK